MNKTRLLIIDEDEAVRRLLSEALALDADFELVGAVAQGRPALTHARRGTPEVVLLGMTKPAPISLATLDALSTLHGNIPVLMLVRPSDRGSSATLEALALGARDFIMLPEIKTMAAG